MSERVATSALLEQFLQAHFTVVLFVARFTMPNSCIVCGHIKRKGEKVSFHRFPAQQEKQQQWLVALGLQESDINEQTRVCSRHFLHGNTSTIPAVDLGKKFMSPKKPDSDRSNRATKRSLHSPFSDQGSKRVVRTPSSRASSSRASSSRASSVSAVTDLGSTTGDEMSVNESGSSALDFALSFRSGASSTASSTALAARVEYLEAETKSLKSTAKTKTVKEFFRVEQIADNDSLVQFYTGFASYQLFLNFFEFLGKAVYELNYWGDSEKKTPRRNKKMPLQPLNQYFLTLVKLRLNLRLKDLSYRFGISNGLVSKYITTWVCFLYQHLKEIDWTPSIEQVARTLPCAFQDKYSTTYSIIDASEIFIETPSDLFMQSSTWSNYKHHNTAKFLVSCTPNGAVSYVSQIYVGSISDVELTRVCGYLNTLDGKDGVSVMADRGFTIKDLLAEKKIELNIPPFMEGKPQLTEDEVKTGRGIASLRIHVERLIGRIKNYSILKSTLPISMIRIANQIVSVCAWLTNFQPVLIPLSGHSNVEEEVEAYFQSIEDSDYDADSEMSDDETEP